MREVESFWEEDGMMSSAQQSGMSGRRIILHHLSGLHYEDTPANRQDSILVRYKGYLELAPEDHRPDLVVITGDLTATGRRQDLTAVAITLRACFPTWLGQLDKHVFIVPGPRDVNWENANAVGLDPFYEIFSDFALPDRPAAPGAGQTSATRQPPATSADDYVAYPVDTCYAPNELHKDFKREFSRFAKQYGRFIKLRETSKKQRPGLKTWFMWRRGSKERVRAKMLERLRLEYLGLMEGSRLIALEAGRINDQDVNRFETWAEPLIHPIVAGAPAKNPLKIIIAYHPLANHPEQDTEKKQGGGAHPPFEQLTKHVRAAGFHLALHGHIHQSRLLSDHTILDGLTTQIPLRQLGAPSLGDTGFFNEITAVYHEPEDPTPGQPEWRFEFHLVNVKATDSAHPNAIALPNPVIAAVNRIEWLKREAQWRVEFERGLRVIMRRYFDHVNAITPENRHNSVPLAQEPVQLAADLIRQVIFGDYDARIRLLLKSHDTEAAAPKLVPTYLTPAVVEGPDALAYPACVAAWALILGKTLIYPGVKSIKTDESDHDWLRRRDTIPTLLGALGALTADALAKSYPGADEIQRYELLHNKLTTISSSGQTTILGKDICQPALTGNRSSDYPGIAYVPYPLRSSGGAPRKLPEIAVLEVGVRQKTQPGVARDLSETVAMEPFTDERVAMLETITELIGMMLMTSSALGKPRGSWGAERPW